MALFDNTQLTDVSARDPRYGSGNFFFTRSGKPKPTMYAANFLARAFGGPLLGDLAAQGVSSLAQNGLSGSDTLAGAQAGTAKVNAAGQVFSQAQKMVANTVAGMIPGGGAVTGALSAVDKAVNATGTKPAPVLAVQSVLPPVPGSENAVDTTLDLMPVWNQTPAMTNPNRVPVYNYEKGGPIHKHDEHGNVIAHTIYPEGDKTEDLLIVDPQTGNTTGRFRFGEYLITQKRTSAAAEIMQQQISKAEKIVALGRLFHDQLESVPVDAVKNEFADGGSLKAYRDAVKKRDELQAKADKLQNDRKTAVGPGAKDVIDQQVIKLNREITQLNQTISANTGAAFPGMSSAGTAAIAGIGPRPDQPAPAAPTRQAPAISGGMGYPVTPESVQTGQRANRLGVITTAGLTDSIVRQNAMTEPAPAATSAPATPPAAAAASGKGSAAGRAASAGLPAGSQYTILPGDTLVKISQKTGIPVIDLANWNGIRNLNEISAGATLSLRPPVPGSLGAGNVQPLDYKTDVFTNQLSTDLSGKVKTPEPATPATAQAPAAATSMKADQILGNITDLSRIAAGLSMAGKPVESPTIPQRWLNYMGELEQRKNTGLSPAERNLAQNQITNNYRQSVNALGSMTGGGANPGTVLAGLANAGLQRGQQTQNLLAAEAAAQRQNFAQYGAATAQTTAMEQGIQAERIARQGQDRQIGVNLAASAMNNIENRAIYNQNQTYWDRLMQSQLQQENEARQGLSDMRRYYAGRI